MFDNKKILNPLQMNDWEFKKFICVVLSIQLAVWGSIGLDVIGLHLPILRQLISFVYLTFIPGLIILRILRLHKLGSAETLIYSVGLSISTLMFIGLLMNVFFPYFGIIKPISIIPLIFTISAFTLASCIVAYFQDKDFSDSSFINLSDLISHRTLFLLMLPFFSIFGTYLMNFYESNIILLILIIAISIIPLVVSLNLIDESAYELIIFTISISLLYHRSLISMNLWGDDIFSEYYYSKLVMETFFWDSSTSSNLNSMLSVVLVPPIYSIISEIDLKWAFKIIFPLLYTFVPLGLYCIFKKQTNKKIAFLSTFFFISFTEFYRVMPVIIRQNIAELFLILLIFLLVDTSMGPVKRSLLMIIYGISLVMSHYALASIYMIFFIIMICELFFREKSFFHKSRYFAFTEDRRIHNSYVLLFSILTLVWYIYTSESSIFNTVVGIGDRIISNIVVNFLNPNYSESMSTALAGTSSLLYTVLKYINVVTMFFITVGICASLFGGYVKPAGSINDFIQTFAKFNSEFLILAFLNFGLLVCSLTLPHFSGNLGTMRIYHLSLIFLAPFCIIGYYICMLNMEKVIGMAHLSLSGMNKFKLLSAFFALYLLFNSGFVHEVFKDKAPCSISLSNQKEYLEMSSLFSDSEVYSAKFLKDIAGNSPVYSDIVGRQLLRAYIWPDQRILFIKEGEIPIDNAFTYFRELNVDGKVMVFAKKEEKKSERPYSLLNIENTAFFNKSSFTNKLYANGGSEIYR